MLLRLHMRRRELPTRADTHPGLVAKALELGAEAKCAINVLMVFHNDDWSTIKCVCWRTGKALGHGFETPSTLRSPQDA